MNKIMSAALSLSLLMFLIMPAHAQRANAQRTKVKTSTTTSHADTSVHVPKTEVEKIASDADNYSKIAADTKSKLKMWFPAKSGDTMYFVIPGITYTDPNLKLLKQKLDGIKNTKGLTSGYKNNTAIVKIVFKGGDVSNLYDGLSDDMKEMFMAEDMEGNRAILNYKLATHGDVTGTKKDATGSKKGVAEGSK